MPEPTVIPRVGAIHLLSVGAQGVPGPQGPAGPPGTGGTGEVTVVAATAGAAVGGHRVVTSLSDGTVVHADVTNPAHVLNVVGMTLGAAASGASVQVAMQGRVEEPSWAWVAGSPIYLTGLGLLTQTVPTSGYALQVAVPLSPTSIVLMVKMPIALL